MNTVHIIEDDQAVADSLQAVLGSWNFDTTVYPDGDAFFSRDKEANCILLDVRLPGEDGLTVLKRLRQTDATTPVIVMTGHGDVRMAVKAMHFGAQDFIEKPFDTEELVTRMNVVIEEGAQAAKCREAISRLTPREADVLKEILAGNPNKVIAYHLDISPKTVELHRARVMEKTEAQSLSQLVRIAVKAGLDIDAPLL